VKKFQFSRGWVAKARWKQAVSLDFLETSPEHQPS
jgi:hypothetical protein